MVGDGEQLRIALSRHHDEKIRVGGHAAHIEQRDIERLLFESKARQAQRRGADLREIGHLGDGRVGG